jgi:hypothetical protein
MQAYMGKQIPNDSSGDLTGELPDFPAGLYAIDKVVPLPTPDEEDQMIAAGQKQRNALGITSSRDLSNWPPGMRAFVRMWRQRRLTLRVSMGLELPDASDPAGLVRQQGVTPGFGDHWLRIDSAGEQPTPPAGNATPQEYKALMGAQPLGLAACAARRDQRSSRSGSAGLRSSRPREPNRR